MKKSDNMRIGTYLGALPFRDGSTFFRVWAPFADVVSVETGPQPDTRRTGLARCEGGYFEGLADNAGHNDLYRYIIDDRYALPDPASRSQPDGVHGSSQILDHALFNWDDNGWKSAPLDQFIMYELHVGTFTGEGTFEAAAGCIEYLKDLGVNAIELMPVAQFPGRYNWGYDGTFPFAVHNSYGGPEGLKTFVDACHREDISVILDVVYNHLGPEGNYLGRYGPYFTDRYRTPWGDAINFDGPFSDEVRHFFIESALAWITDYHIDVLRIDAIHGIFDFSAKTFLGELSEAVNKRGRELGRGACLIAESDLNDIRTVTPARQGGSGFDAQWNDDFHHALHTILTGEQNGYYCDFGTIEHMAKAYREGYIYTGQYSQYRRKRHGSPSRHIPAARFVVFSQNHDQVGNRALGDRLGSLVPMEKLRTAAVAVLLSSGIPLLFMGEEYGETAPFLYFVNHSDKALIDAVRSGRAEEFSSFDWKGNIPDPQSEETFMRSKVNRQARFAEPHSSLYDFYRHLTGLRHSLRPWEMKKKRPDVKLLSGNNVLRVLMPLRTGDISCFFNFSGFGVPIRSPLPAASWTKIVDTASPRWGGEGEMAPPDIGPSAAGASMPSITIGPFNSVVYRRKVG